MFILSHLLTGVPTSGETTEHEFMFLRSRQTNLVYKSIRSKSNAALAALVPWSLKQNRRRENENSCCSSWRYNETNFEEVKQ